MVARTGISTARTGISARTGLTFRQRQIFSYPYMIQTNGTNNELSVANFDPTGSSGLYLTAWAWVSSDISQQQRYIFGMYDTNNQRSWLMITNSVGTYRVLLSTGGSVNTKDYRARSFPNILDGDIHFVAFTWDNGTLSLYVNGELETNPLKTTDTAMTALFASTAKLALGNGYATGTVAQRTRGLLGKCGVSSVVATANQIRDLYYEGKMNLSSASGQWEFTEGSGTSVNDASGNSRTMTVTNGTWVTTTPRTARTGL